MGCKFYGVHITQGSVADLTNVSVMRGKGEGIVVNGLHSMVKCRNCKLQHNEGTGVSVVLCGRCLSFILFITAQQLTSDSRADIQECDLRFNKLGPL